MKPAEKFFNELSNKFDDAKEATMFGWRCISYKRKPFIFLDKETDERLAFKLGKARVHELLDYKGNEVFNPGDKGKPMTNWMMTDASQKKQWNNHAVEAYELILTEVKKKIDKQ